MNGYCGLFASACMRLGKFMIHFRLKVAPVGKSIVFTSAELATSEYAPVSNDPALEQKGAEVGSTPEQENSHVTSIGESGAHGSSS